VKELKEAEAQAAIESATGQAQIHKAVSEAGEEKFIKDAQDRAEKALEQQRGSALSDAERKTVRTSAGRSAKRAFQTKRADAASALDAVTAGYVADKAANEIRARAFQTSSATSALTAEQAQRRVVAESIKAGQESTERQQNQQYGAQTALAAAAVAEGRTTLEDRQEAYGESETRRIVTEEAGIDANRRFVENREKAGVQEKTYQVRVDETKDPEYDRQLDTLASQAAVSRKISASDGTQVSIRDSEVDRTTIPQLIEIAKNGEEAEQIAALDRLMGARASQASYDLAYEALVGPDKPYGGDAFNTVSAERKRVWDKGVRNSKQADASKPPIAAYTDMSPRDVVALGYNGTKRALKLYEFLRNDYEKLPDGSVRPPGRERDEKKKYYDAQVAAFNDSVQKAAKNTNIGGNQDPRAWKLIIQKDTDQTFNELANQVFTDATRREVEKSAAPKPYTFRPIQPPPLFSLVPI
jgi:hypothetical protein